METLYQSVPLSNLNETDHIYTLNQVLATNWACQLGNEDCIAYVKDAFNQFRVDSVRYVLVCFKASSTMSFTALFSFTSNLI